MRSSLTSAPIKLLSFLLFSFFSLPLLAQDADSLLQEVDSLAQEEIKSPFNSYFEPLSSEEAQAAYEGINTNGVISNYKLVENVRTVNDDWRVTDPHHMMTAAGIDTLNRIIRMVENETGYQMAVVCVNSIGDNDPTTWSHDLFNYWGIGEAGKDNGFLCVVINDIHRVEFANGYGTETVLTDLMGEDIRQKEMIPYFKQNDYTTGIIRGMQKVADVFYGAPPDYYSSGDYTYDKESDYDYSYEEPYSEPVAFIDRPIVRFYLKIVIGLTILYLIFLIVAFLTKDLHKRYHRLKLFTLLIFPIAFPIPFLALYFLNRSLMNKWRNTERFSQNTGEFMIKLSESEDDQHLKSGQVTEEQIKSIDYDVWVTQDRSEVLILAYKRWFSKYRKCPKCRHKTYYKEYDRTITPATYSSSGTGERKHSCKSCGHSKITRYTIPQKTQSSGGSSSGGGYSSGSSYSGGSSGGSYGGGSSGGGGGGSSW